MKRLIKVESELVTDREFELNIESYEEFAYELLAFKGLYIRLLYPVFVDRSLTDRVRLTWIFEAKKEDAERLKHHYTNLYKYRGLYFYFEILSGWSTWWYKVKEWCYK